MNSLLRHALASASSLLSMNQWSRLSTRLLLLPFYHVVSNEHLPHIAPLYRYKTQKEFSRDLDTLLRHFQPATLSQVYASISSETPFSKPTFFLSFDDGLKEVLEIVAPILQKKGIPATVFVNPDFVGNKKLFYRYKAALLHEALPHYKGNLPSFPFLKTRDKSDWGKWILAAHHEHDAQLEQLAEVLDVDFLHFLDTKQPYLNLSDLYKLKSQGWNIGAHSMDHPDYRYLSISEQVRQTKTSLLWISEQKLESIPSFAFPFTDFGVGKKLFQEVNKGNVIPTLFFGTAGFKTEHNPFHLQRLPMEGTSLSANQLIKSEFSAYLIKKTMGKEFIKRGD